MALIALWRDVVVARHRIDVEDNLLARQLGTRIDILARIANTLIAIVAVGMILTTFPEIRALGTTLLASAGVAGIVAGLAARPLFENLVAGIQLALTQPIRLDDVVIVEKQYGRIEEIHSTYVVVKLWDLRRLVVPLTYFIETPFENWTRRTANLMGEVYFFADFTLDIAALRAEIPEMVKRSPLWDGNFQNLQVTDATDRAMQVRVLVTARNSTELFDLRCFVREQIVTYLRDHQPQALPRVRFDPPAPGDDRAESQMAPT
jgi:small-conductance mechanosensitive channel